MMEMGLDVTVYGKISEADESQEYDAGCFKAFAHPDFPNQFDWLKDGQVYSSEDVPDAPDISAGYGSYNHWRDQLAEMAGYPEQGYDDGLGVRRSHAVACWNGAEGPFAELINFSDCEGIIGPDTSKKLAADFAQFQEKANAFPWQREELYDKFRKAFEIASNGGAVHFH